MPKPGDFSGTQHHRAGIVSTAHTLSRLLPLACLLILCVPCAPALAAGTMEPNPEFEPEVSNLPALLNPATDVLVEADAFAIRPAAWAILIKENRQMKIELQKV